MPTELPRMMLTLTPELLEKLEEYRRRQKRIPSKAEAVRELLEKALEQELSKYE